jgi:pSer/pThr/pTyr-binding forkhead associated (FHA) protein
MEKTRIIIDRDQQPSALISKAGASERTICGIKQRVTSIGRNPGNDVVLKDSTVSNYHATIRLEDRGYFIYDFASENGTRVNGRKIYRKKLVDGDIIQLGQSVLVFASKEVSLSFISKVPAEGNNRYAG